MSPPPSNPSISVAGSDGASNGTSSLATTGASASPAETFPNHTSNPNTKRYWGEERNIDSIYSIYLKKISYSLNNDTSLSNSFAESCNSTAAFKRAEVQQHQTQSISELAKSTIQANGGAAYLTPAKQDNSLDRSKNCHASEQESPKRRGNFFQRYRRRSHSIDKYSLEKQQKQLIHPQDPLQEPANKDQQFLTPNPPKKKNKEQSNMRFLTPQQQVHPHNQQVLSVNLDKTADSQEAALSDVTVSHDDLDLRNGHRKHNSNRHSNSNNHQKFDRRELHKSTHELYNSDKFNHSALSQSALLWETRQIKVLQAATLDHILKLILLINPTSTAANLSAANSSEDPWDPSKLEEERNSVAHIIHVLFCTYRIYTNPYELMLKLMDYSDLCRIEQYRFVMHYWMDNYPEDFEYVVSEEASNGNGSSGSTSIYRDGQTQSTAGGASLTSHNNSITSHDSSTTAQTVATSESSSATGSDNLNRRLSSLSLKTGDDVTRSSGTSLVDELLRLCKDEYIRKKALKLNELRNSSLTSNDSGSDRSSRRHHRHHRMEHSSTRNSAVLDLDSRYVAQQLTAIDLENFLSLRPYSLLEGTKSDKRVQSMVRNFNLLSRQVVVTILRTHAPQLVAQHWIAIAKNLRKIKNFNSLKAIIAGLTNESVYRLKQNVWSKVDKSYLADFRQMADIVDDVNNQTVLRQTQLIVEGTAKVSIEDDSFGTIPYLGTFLTDLNMIDARYPNYVPSPRDENSKLKLINFEKCAKQFEILTQVQLLQKNVLASLHAIQRKNLFDEQTTLNRLKLEYNQNQQMVLAKPAIPQVAKLFETWFYDKSVSAMTDKQCYEISLTLEPNVVQR